MAGIAWSLRDLTRREAEICQMVACGHSNKEIGARLHLATGTIKEYLVRVFKKTGVTNRTALALEWTARVQQIQDVDNCDGCLLRAAHLHSLEETKDKGAQ